ncbi:blue copper protein-like [Abrus precatorius]|uniref:Blue copper protein-like n=1 Tax=Abrus precatorius TaxID=3816 RepID=A0A8B8MIJ2_ABRPR|nr:blue copper protein-like [Abrus precatorius]
MLLKYLKHTVGQGVLFKSNSNTKLYAYVNADWGALSHQKASTNALVLGLCLAINMALPTLAAIHTVGDTSGWTIGTDYSTWAGSLTFVVGDSLVFNYGTGHSVDKVKKSDYKTCSVGNSLSTESSGATTIGPKSVGTHYFICSIPGHCKGGMKLAVAVKARKATAPAVSPSSSKDSHSDETTDTPTNNTKTKTEPSNSYSSNKSSATGLSPIVAMLAVSLISYYVLCLASIFPESGVGTETKKGNGNEPGTTMATHAQSVTEVAPQPLGGSGGRSTTYSLNEEEE